jgi:hypothetical protein
MMKSVRVHDKNDQGIDVFDLLKGYADRDEMKELIEKSVEKLLLREYHFSKNKQKGFIFLDDLLGLELMHYAVKNDRLYVLLFFKIQTKITMISQFLYPR